MFSISVFSYWLKVCQWTVPLYTRMDTLHGSQWQVTAPYTDLSDNLWPPTQISVTSYGPPTQNSVTSYGPPTLISVTIGTRILKLKLKIRVKMKFFTILTMFIVILRSFYIIYVEISFHLTVPLMSDTSYLIFDIWYLISDTWYLILDIWFLTYDTWYLIL